MKITREALTKIIKEELLKEQGYEEGTKALDKIELIAADLLETSGAMSDADTEPASSFAAIIAAKGHELKKALAEHNKWKNYGI